MSAAKHLIIDKNVWKDLVAELRRRGLGERESGAFLLSGQGDNRITKFICYDDLDPNCLDHGIITFDGSGYVPLWDYCKQHDLIVLADVHTHPESWVGQSRSDSNHPMIPQAGHIAIILPEYAQPHGQDLTTAGLYEYLGDKKWKTLKRGNNRVKISET